MRTYLLLHENPAVSLTRERARSGRGSRSKGQESKIQQHHLPAMDSKLLDAVITKVAPNFTPPMAATLPDDIVKQFGGLVAKGRIEDFVATQDAFMTEVAQIEVRHSGLDVKESTVEVRRLVENTAAINAMASRHENPPVDMVAAVQAIGIQFEDPSEIDWKHLHIPGTAKGFFVMPHQLADPVHNTGQRRRSRQDYHRPAARRHQLQ